MQIMEHIYIYIKIYTQGMNFLKLKIGNKIEFLN